jgi:methionyl-tRNA formyltransferase
MSAEKASLLFLGRMDDTRSDRALAFCQKNFGDVTEFLSANGLAFPGAARSWQGDYVVSYLSRWIVPIEVLAAARIAAINFHPGPPEYPGTGCVNFALYERATQYGVTCHHMEPAVDSGEIVAVRRFLILPHDTVASLLVRTHDHLLALFYETMSEIVTGRPLPQAVDRWTRKPFTRWELNDLSRITPEMDPGEIARRVRATDFPPWRPLVEIGEYSFEFKGMVTRSRSPMRPVSREQSRATGNDLQVP